MNDQTRATTTNSTHLQRVFWAVRFLVQGRKDASKGTVNRRLLEVLSELCFSCITIAACHLEVLCACRLLNIYEYYFFYVLPVWRAGGQAQVEVEVGAFAIRSSNTFLISSCILC